MKRYAVVAAMSVVLPVLAMARAPVRQDVGPEQEIISLVHQFAGEAILLREGEALEIHGVSVRISGDTALFTGRADVSGREASGRAYTHPHRLSVEYVRRAGGWQVRRGEWRKAVK